MSFIDKETALNAEPGDVLHDMHDGFGTLQHTRGVIVSDPVEFPAEGGEEFILNSLRTWGISKPRYLNKHAVVVNVVYLDKRRVCTVVYSYDNRRFGLFTVSVFDDR